MRQVLVNSTGVFVARMPKPVVEPGKVLVRVRYSLISVGTEVAAARPATQALREAITAGQLRTNLGLARTYLKRALDEPAKAVRYAARIAKATATEWLPRASRPTRPPLSIGPLEWTRCAAAQFEVHDGAMHLVTDASPGSYQVMSQVVEVPPDRVPVIAVRGMVHEGAFLLGLLNQNRDQWLGFRTFDAGVVQDSITVDQGESAAVTLVIATVGGVCRATLDKVVLDLHARDGLPVNELSDQGSNLGYSVAGEVLAVGAGIDDLAAGDLVACAGAGQANHADYVSVSRNLVCRVPPGCTLDLAASATVGSIALQGVRRAAPQLGDTVCVLGLGLIGQITAQLLRANGCRVIGMDLDPARVKRALDLRMTAGTTDRDELLHLVRDTTGGHGADRTLITAATESDEVINLAMEATRAKGTVVIVGAVGMNVQRPAFYRKELDLLMSTSYGPGRYDRSYEDDGHDYPLAYVRWTLNRNMHAYLNLVASGNLDIRALIDAVVPIEDAPRVYRELVERKRRQLLGVVLHYTDETRELPDPAASTQIVIRGHRQAPQGPLHYALVGAGGFGTAMLVPQLKKLKDRFFLRAVVSRTLIGSNFARANEIEILTTDLDTVLANDAVGVVVIATRHHEHADQVVHSLAAGKHVFVEKPLALTWGELDRIIGAYRTLAPAPVLMVGFNRRFSPALQTAKEALDGRRSPVVINYRLNGGSIPLDSWIQGAQGGGRNLGEACHMYDVFRFLAGAPVCAIRATAIDPADLPYLRNDNFCATMRYEDGSVGNLVYTALGPKTGMGKERVEIFCDGEAYVVDDYKSLLRASDGVSLWQSTEVDKGHYEELRRFGDAIATGVEAPIPFDEIVETSAVALHVEDLLFGRTDD